MLAGSHRNAWPDETGTGGRTNRNTHHQGKMCCGRTPMETFIDGKKVWEEKNLNQI